MRRASHRLVANAAALTVAALLAGCGSSASKATTHQSPTTSTTGRIAATNMRTKRYCEVLLVHPGTGGLTADVFNSYPMNDCPESQWAALDATTLASENQVPIAQLNGPRYWLVNAVRKEPGTEVRRTFGGIEMIQRATVTITDVATASAPYTANHVNRETVFTFDRGETVYELTGPDGAKYVMQSWSQEKDPGLVEADLAALGSRLALPSGWSYSSRELTAPLRVVTTTQSATVVQDDLRNSYSLETTG